MQRRRDRLIVLGAVVVMVAIAALIITTVFDAQRRGRRALERQKIEQIDALAGSMDQRIDSAYTAIGGIAALPFNFQVGNQADQQLLERLQGQNPAARTGYMLVDSKGRVTAGTLLLDPSTIGETLDRPGLKEALKEGTDAVLPVAPGKTTKTPTIGILSPSVGADGTVKGGFLLESEVSADSDFNQEVSALGGPTTGQVMFIDQSGKVVASSDPSRIGSPTDDAMLLSQKKPLQRADGMVTVVADVPKAGWRAVFQQDSSDFEGGLSRQLQLAVLLIVVVGVVLGGLAILALENRLRAAREEQRRLAEINDAREEFISIVSHELRTPVAGVLGFLQTTLDHWDQLTEEERRDTIGRAAVNARRLQGLTRDVLDVASVEQGQIRYAFGPVNLREEIDAAVLAMREQQPDRDISLDAVQQPAWVHADGDRLLQVLGNLFDNATASSPAGSPVEVALNIDGADVVVSMTDHGAGLSEGEAGAIFQKFVRGRTSGVRGTGLGLYLCSQIITAHGGRIWAETADDGGARFCFSLPHTSAPADAPSDLVDSPT